jgi:hypothetical protein
VALVIVVSWYQFERYQAKKLRQAAATEPTRRLILGDRPMSESIERVEQTQSGVLARGTESNVPAVRQLPHPVAAPPRVETLYLCKSYGGGMFWSKTICHQLRATIDRIATVPGALPFEQQVAIAQGEAQAAAALARPPAIPAPALRSTQAPTSAECGLLENLVREIDAAARQPQPAYRQDSLKDQRLRARSRQAQLRC